MGRRRTIAFGELLEHPLVGLPADSGLSRFLAAQASRSGRVPRHRVRLSGFDGMAQLVAAGVGIAILPRFTTRSHGNGIVTRPITGLPAGPLDTDYGIEGPVTVAIIDEDWCIGCTLCIKACPTDAIVGIHKRMHTVVEPHCTGCELCIPVCPVDCISLEPVSGQRTGWQHRHTEIKLGICANVGQVACGSPDHGGFFLHEIAWRCAPLNYAWRMDAILFRKINPVAQRLHHFRIVVLDTITLSIGQDTAVLCTKALKQPVGEAT